MLAGLHAAFRLIEAVVGGAFGSDGGDAVVVQHFALAAEPVDVLVGAVGGGHGPTPLFIGLEDTGQLDIGIVEDGAQLAGGVGVFGSVLGYTNCCHGWLLRC